MRCTILILFSFVCFISIGQYWDAVAEYDTNISNWPYHQKFYQHDVFQNRLYIANIPTNGKVFHASYDGFGYRAENRVNKAAEFQYNNAGVYEMRYYNLGDTSLLFTNVYDGFNDTIYAEIWRFDSDTSVLLSKYVPIHGVNYNMDIAIANDNFYAYMASHAKAPNGKDSMALIKVENGVSDTLTKFLAGGAIWATSNTGILIRGNHQPTNGQSNPFPGQPSNTKSYWNNGLWTFPTEQNFPVIKDYIPYQDGFIYTESPSILSTSDPKGRVVYFDGLNFHYVGDSSFIEAFGIDEYKGKVYVTATEDSTTQLYVYDGTSWDTVQANNILRQGTPYWAAPELFELHFLKDYCYLSGQGMYVSNFEVGYSDSTASLVRLPMFNANNLPPTAHDETIQTNDTTITRILVNTNDTDPNEDYLYVRILEQGAHGTAELDTGTDEIIYTPTIFFEGLDSVKYAVCDLGGLCDSTWLKIDVHAVAMPLVINADYHSCMEDQDSAYHVLGNDDYNNQSTNYALVDSALHGQAYFLPNGELWYSPDTTFAGKDSCQYEVCTTFGLCDSAWVYFDVILINEAPVGVNDTFLIVQNSQVLNVHLNDSDPETEPLRTEIIDGPFHANASAEIVDNRHIRYSNPSFDNFIKDSVQYAVYDIHDYGDTAWLFLNQNFKPQAVNDTLRLSGDQGDVLVLANDVDPDGHDLHYIVIDGPFVQGNTFYSCGVGCRTYVNNSGSNFLRDSVQYVLGDQYGATDTAWIQIEAENLEIREQDFKKFYVYPNPAVDELKFNVPVDGAIEIYSMQGKLVKIIVAQKTDSILIEELSSGIYLLRINGGKETYHRKFEVRK